MMELVKKHIHMNRRRGNVTSQITLDDDFNVPDSMDDVEELILDSGEIQIESAKNLGEKVAVRGKLNFRVLYRKPDGGLMTLAGTLPFEENVNVPGLKEQDFLQAGWELDDLNIGLINSRKLSVKALVTLKIQAETLYDAEAAVDAEFDGNVEILKKTITVAAIAVRRKDTFRVKEVLTLSGNKPDIDTLLWQDLRLRGVNTKPLDGKIHIDLETASQCIQKRVVRYDKTGDNHYDTISAFIKSMRGSDPDAAVFYLAKMLYAGEDIKFIARRIMICAAEDVGNADPQALQVAVAAAQAVERLGMPEARIPLAQAVTYVASAPKSNAAYLAVDEAMEAVRSVKTTVPVHLQDSHYKGAAKMGHGIGYQYAHDYPNHYVKQQYLPSELEGRVFYRPTDNGYEQEIQEYFRKIRENS